MSEKWHINDLGKVGLCKAKNGNCPFDKNAGHFANKDDAYKWIKEKELEKDNLLPRHKGQKDYKVASSRKDAEHMRKRKLELAEAVKNPYIERCRSSERVHTYEVSEKATEHYREDRVERDEKIIEIFGEGELIGHYKVNQLVTSNGRSLYRDQMIEIRNNGRIIVYDYRTGSKVTTFIAHRAKIEVMMLLANNIPDESFLEIAHENRNSFKKLGL